MSKTNLQRQIQTLEFRYSQKEIAKRLGVSTRTVRRWKSGAVKNPTKTHKTKLNRTIGGLKSQKLIAKDVQRITPAGNTFNKAELAKVLREVAAFNKEINNVENFLTVNIFYDSAKTYDEFTKAQRDVPDKILSRPIKIKNDNGVNGVLDEYFKPFKTDIYEIRLSYDERIKSNGKGKATKKNKNKKSKKKKNSV